MKIIFKFLSNYFIIAIINLILRNQSKTYVLTLNDKLFGEYGRLRHLKMDQNECLLDEHEPLIVKSLLSPTILIATALEKFKYYSSHSDKRKTRLKSYSILFQIKKILKYENLVNNTYNKSNELYNISSQDEYSMQINLNSFFLVENITPSHDESCLSTDIKLSMNYILFLSGQNRTISLDKRRFFTYPIRLSLLNKTTKRLKRIVKSSGGGNTRQSIFIRMPIFSIYTKPVNYDKQIESEISLNLNSSNRIETRLVIDKTVKATLNKTIHIECKLTGLNYTQINWLKSTDNNSFLIQNSFKYFINSNFLTVFNFHPSDQADYYCFTYTYHNGDIFSEKLIYDSIKLNLDSNKLVKSSTSKISTTTRKKWLKTSTKRDFRLEAKTTIKKFIPCDSKENECQNGGECLKTNPLFYKDNIGLYNLIKAKFCICKEFYEGPYCEFELSRNLKISHDDIPGNSKMTQLFMNVSFLTHS
ncbi:unnamed protein product [Brachionus calyciflorus]|uniref:Ig-like domain-containing protein n=1 Tax=Brachionus calyciflorus TaxID=104777 RepID=A0A814GSJ0_9BILA|nr:unnamed protein product [Brachionus calyciflorus]